MSRLAANARLSLTQMIVVSLIGRIDQAFAKPSLVRRGPAQVWSELGQQPSMRQQLVLQILRQTAELSVEGVVKQNGPGHAVIMA